MDSRPLMKQLMNAVTRHEDHEDLGLPVWIGHEDTTGILNLEHGEMETATPVTTTCLVCDAKPSFRWTDTHGIAVCTTCGLPYRLYHYEDDARVEKPPECTVKPEWIALAREYWQATRERVFPGAHDMGFFRGRGGRTYSGATEEQMNAFDEWMESQKARWPQKADPVASERH